LCRRLAGGIEKIREALPDQLLGSLSHKRHGGRIGLDDPQTAGVDDQHSLARQLKQQTISLLRAADQRIFALHRLLRLGDAQLQGRHRAQIAPDNDESAVGAETDGGMANGDIGPLRGGIIDLPPPRGGLHGRIAQQFLDLGAALRSDRVDPFPADPVLIGLLSEIGVAEGDIAHDALTIDDQGDVRRGNDQRRGGLGVDRRERIGGGREPIQCCWADGLDH